MPRSTHRALLAAVAACLFATAPALAKQEKAEARLALEPSVDRAALAEQRARIEAAIATEAYVEITRTDRTELREGLDAIQARLPADGDIASLPAADQAWLQERGQAMNKLLDRAYADSRLTCSRQQQIGSSFRRKVCTTAAQRRRDQENIADQARQGRPMNTVGDSPAN